MCIDQQEVKGFQKGSGNVCLVGVGEGGVVLARMSMVDEIGEGQESPDDERNLYYGYGVRAVDKKVS